MKEDQTIEIRFLHPRDAGITLRADIGVDITGREVIDELMRDVDGAGAFLAPLADGQDYTLSVRRTEQAIAPDMTLTEAGIVDGDEIAVQRNATGGGPGQTWFELGQMVFWSVAAASIFLKYASPILVEFLRGRSSRSIKIRDGNYEIEITGESPEKALEILEMLRNKRRDTLDVSPAGGNDRLASPITVTLRDSKGDDPMEDDSG